MILAMGRPLPFPAEHLFEQSERDLLWRDEAALGDGSSSGAADEFVPHPSRRAKPERRCVYGRTSPAAVLNLILSGFRSRGLSRKIGR
jgi:hypothetical protein